MGLLSLGFSLVGLKLKHSQWLLRSNGLQSRLIELENGSTIHCWTPIIHGNRHDGSISSDVVEPSKPALLLLHGFGAEGTIAWENQVAILSKHFSLYMPDLLFFGRSTTSNEERSELFQAECVYEAMRKVGLQEAMVGGHSYGGFVAYRMAHLYPSFVRKVVIVSSGVMMNPHSNDQLLEKSGFTNINDILVPRNVADFKKSLKFAFNDLPWLPNFVYRDLFQSMSSDRQRRLELIEGLVLGTEKAPPLPRIEQNVLIIWGDEDQIFNIALGHQLKDFLGAKAELATIKGVGHMPPMVKPKEFNRLMLPFLMRS